MTPALSKSDVMGAAINVIEKGGLHRFSIEKVAASIGRDIQEVLVLFPDSNTLVRSALEESMVNGLNRNLDECIQNYQGDKEFLTQLFSITLSGAMSHPKLMRSHFYSSFILENSHSVSTKRLQRFIAKTWDVVEPHIDKVHKRTARRRLDLAFSSILFASLFPVMLEPVDPNMWAHDLAHFVMNT